MPEWIKDCVVCNEGLIQAMEDRIATGSKVKAASRELAKEAEAAHGAVVISPGAIKERYRYHKQGRTNWDKTPSANEFEEKFKCFLAHLRTSMNALVVVNRSLPHEDIANVVPLMSRVDVKESLKEITKFLLMWTRKRDAR